MHERERNMFKKVMVVRQNVYIYLQCPALLLTLRTIGSDRVVLMSVLSKYFLFSRMSIVLSRGVRGGVRHGRQDLRQRVPAEVDGL